jgi:hypothetical protein
MEYFMAAGRTIAMVDKMLRQRNSFFISLSHAFNNLWHHRLPVSKRWGRQPTMQFTYDAGCLPFILCILDLE